MLPPVSLPSVTHAMPAATATLLGVFDQTSPLAAAFAAPIALWELALGVWLTFRGFRADAVERLV